MTVKQYINMDSPWSQQSLTSSASPRLSTCDHYSHQWHSGAAQCPDRKTTKDRRINISVSAVLQFSPCTWTILTALENASEPTPRSNVPKPRTCRVVRLTLSQIRTWGCSAWKTALLLKPVPWRTASPAYTNSTVLPTSNHLHRYWRNLSYQAPTSSDTYSD